MVRRLLVLLLALACLPAVGRAQETSRKVVVLKADRLLDVRSGALLADYAILIEGDRIRAVGPAATIARNAPRDAKVVSLSGVTVLPGLIDCHAHVLGNPKDLSPIASLRMSSAQAALWGVHNVQVYLNKGFTTLRDAGEADLGYGQVALRDSIARGLVVGPRLLSSGNFISVSGGHGDADALAPDQALPPRPNIADTMAELERAVRHDMKYGVDWIKLMATGGISDPMSDFNVQELSEEQMAVAVALAHGARKRVLAHAEGTEGIKAPVRAGVDSIEHGTMLDDEGAALMAQRGITLVPTLYVFQRYAEIGATKLEPVTYEKTLALIQHQQPAFERALRHGVKIAYGVDDDPDYASKEFSALVRGGMSPLEALRAATINGAELLGLAEEIGSLEPGKAADIITVAGDPLSDITAMEKVVFVMKGGAIVKNDLATGEPASP